MDLRRIHFEKQLMSNIYRVVPHFQLDAQQELVKLPK